ncbi:hypothetical protein OH118_15725, partial [Pseudomonas aeruginosa]|uniref:hypothetical protein n=1 Tax=Pseudomonas aeruginosa TaxID=287 RepID=UPI0022569969
TQLAAGAEVDPWQSVSSGNTQLAVGAEVDPWQSVSGRNTQLAAGAEARTWWSGSSGNTHLAVGADLGISTVGNLVGSSCSWLCCMKLPTSLFLPFQSDTSQP